MNNYIFTRSFDKLGYHHVTQDNLHIEPPPGVIICYTDEIHVLFKNYRRNKYIVVSPTSDFGVVEQKDNPVNADMIKRLDFVPWKEFISCNTAYQGIPPACNLDNCNIQDKYSIKMYAYTKSTFNEIPDNIVKWYTCNPGIYHPKVNWLPFGILDKGIDFNKFKNVKKEKLLYVNFQLYTHERTKLLEFFKGQPWATTQLEPNIPPEDYYREIASHKFILCPFGNGYDCYRNYESMLIGSVPVLHTSIFSSYFGDLPVLMTNNFYGLTPEILEDSYSKLSKKDINLEKISLSYWKALLEKEHKELLSV